MATLTFDKVTKWHRTVSGDEIQALAEVSFQVEEGEWVAVVGRSGCGKSTLLRLAAGLDQPSSGQVLVDGAPVTAPSGRVALVFQEPNLMPWRTVLANVEFGLELRDLPVRERRRLAQEYIRLVGLGGWEHAYPYELSGGMRQRTALARALVTHPRVILMDEPFAALDALTRSEMQAELLTLRSRENPTVLLVTHSVEEAAFVADRVVILTPRPGRVRQVVTVDLPWPRDRTSPAFTRVCALVTAGLTAQV